jgi:hypothetical protein
MTKIALSDELDHSRRRLCGTAAILLHGCPLVRKEKKP